MKLAFAVAVMLAAACGPKLVWHGKSPDRQRELRVVEDHGQFIVLDGKRGATYEGIGIGALAFSPDSRHLAYAARRGKRWHIVVDGREGPAYDGISEVRYSADSAHLVYAAELAGTWRLVADGRAGPVFDALLAGSVTFSSTGRLAYAGARGGSYHVVIDGVVGPRFAAVGSLTFSDDGKHVAYVAQRDGAAVAVIDQGVGPSYQRIGEIVLSAIGGHAGYIAQKHGAWHAVVDGVEGPAWDLAKGLAFSSDGAHSAYVARRSQGDSFVIVDGVEGTSYLGVRPATLAFAGRNVMPTYVAQRDFQFFVVHGGKEGPAFDDVRAPVHSADGSHWAYVGRLGDRWIPVIDGVEARAERWVGDLVLSPHGDRAAYLARRGADVAVVVSGVEHRFDIVLEGTLVFDATGKHWGCLAGSRAKRQFDVVVDGVRRAPLEITEAIDATTRTQAAGLPLSENDRVLRAWVAAELARAVR